MVALGDLLYFLVGAIALVVILVLGAWLRQRNSENAGRIAKQVVGMTKTRALKRIRSKGLPHRIIQEDDRKYITTGGHKPDRINLVIRDGKVINFEIG